VSAAAVDLVVEHGGRDADPGPASERGGVELLTRRIATVALGIVAIAATAGTAIIFAESGGTLPAEGFVAYLAGGIGPVLLAGALAPWVSARWLRWIAAIILVEQVLLLAFLLSASVFGALPSSELPWYLTTPAIPAAAAMLAVGRRTAWGMLIGIGAAVELARVLSPAGPLPLLSSDLLAVFASATLVLLVDALLVAARQRDRESARALAAASERAVAEARARAADRVATLTHDELLATLLLAAEGRPDLRAAIAQRAARARRLLRDLGSDDPGGPVPTAALVAALEADALAIAPGAEVLVDAAATSGATRAATSASGPDEGSELPASVAAAVRGATAQAVTNAVQHAAATRIVVRISPSPRGIGVVVTDDGGGFDPAAVSGARMGIASSILGRVRSLPGGAADVTSEPGAGTRVTVGWERATPTATPTAPVRIADGGILVPDDRGVRRGLLAVIGAFLLGVALLAGLASLRSDAPLVHAAAWLGLVGAFAAMGWRTLTRPSAPRTAIVLAATILVAALAWVPVSRDPDVFGDVWYVPALGIMLVALAARGRPGGAALGGALTVVITVSAAIVVGEDPLDLLSSTVRLIAFLLIGLLLVTGTARLQRRTAAAQSRRLEEEARAAARDAGRRVLRERSAEVETLIGRTLDRLAGPEPLADADRAECAALEGLLRDQYRAGRLAAEPLTSAALRARRRGVDVLLLDDSTRALAPGEAVTVVRWMAERLDEVGGGDFTGRVLPRGHAALASAVTEAMVAELLDEASPGAPGG